MNKIVNQNPVSQSFARKLFGTRKFLGRSAIGTIAAAVILPMASFAVLAGTSVPAYAQVAGDCRTANDEETIKAMQALIASLDAEIANLQAQLPAADAEVTQAKADIAALDQMFAAGVRVENGAQRVNELNGKLADAQGKVAQINGQISNDQGHKARAEGVLKALLAKQPCPPPAVTYNPPVNPPAIVVNRTFDTPVIAVTQPAVPSTFWSLVDRIRFNDDGTETWRWKDGHESIRSRTGVTPELPRDRTRDTLPVTHTTPSDTIKGTLPATHTVPSDTRTLGTTTTHARVDARPTPVAEHVTTSVGRPTISNLAQTSTMHTASAGMGHMPSMGGGSVGGRSMSGMSMGGMGHAGGMQMGMARMGGMGKLR
jgi:uncharacterized coiled-coil protein SlyX